MEYVCLVIGNILRLYALLALVLGTTPTCKPRVQAGKKGIQSGYTAWLPTVTKHLIAHIGQNQKPKPIIDKYTKSCNVYRWGDWHTDHGHTYGANWLLVSVLFGFVCHCIHVFAVCFASSIFLFLLLLFHISNSLATACCWTSDESQDAAFRLGFGETFCLRWNILTNRFRNILRNLSQPPLVGFLSLQTSRRVDLATGAFLDPVRGMKMIRFVSTLIVPIPWNIWTTRTTASYNTFYGNMKDW